MRFASLVRVSIGVLHSRTHLTWIAGFRQMLYSSISLKLSTVFPIPRLMTNPSALHLSANVLFWSHTFFTNRLQYSFVNNTASSNCLVTSGVPQRSVLAPLFFLVFSNDLLDRISSSLRLFADDCVIYRTIHFPLNTFSLQHDFNTLSHWRLSLNIAKWCHVPLSRSLQSSHDSYHLFGVILASSSSYNYLDVTLIFNLTRANRVYRIAENSTLGFIKRNLRLASHMLNF